MIRLGTLHWSTAATLAASLLFALGCGGGGGPERFRVSGTIVYGGKPVPAGTILFDPDSTQGSDGPQGYAVIRDGRYDTDQGGNGTIGGPHRVRISGFDGVGVTDDAPYGRAIFLNYQTTADLPEEPTTKDFDASTPPGA